MTYKMGQTRVLCIFLLLMLLVTMIPFSASPIRAAGSDISIESASPLPLGTVGIEYAEKLTASGGEGNYVWSLQSGTLPAGLTFNSNGTIAGTPKTSVMLPVTLSFCVTDAIGNSATKDLSITVAPAPIEAPQVRWAGEKVVLEKYFDPTLAGTPVCFKLDNPIEYPGSLEALTFHLPEYTGLEQIINSQEKVWAVVDADGCARCMLESETYGEVHVTLAVYNRDAWVAGTQIVENQYGYVTFFLKLEEITLSSVAGNRASGHAGLWVPENPWDSSTDVTSELKDLSQDSLLRARVKGWFWDEFNLNNRSDRPARYIDFNGDGSNYLMLPPGRWVLPDDWGILAARYGANWEQDTFHWDIMDNPTDTVTGATPLGPFNTACGDTAVDVTGPFSLGIEIPTAVGWDVGSTSNDPLRLMKTVVPNSELEASDAPMPPAKIVFEILSGGGCFETAAKSDIYNMNSDGDIVYTNPFYQAMIPAHEAIPAFLNNGGYDWNSFDTTQPNSGPYMFWTGIISPYWENIDQSHPAKMQVYTDNHGEAMMYFNCDWNTGLGPVSTIQATADYPYFRKHIALISSTVTESVINTEPGDNVSVSLPSEITVNFAEVADSGVTNVTVSTEAPPVPDGFQLSESPICYDLTTTISFSGPIQISIGYDPSKFTVPEAELRLLHWEGSAYVDCTVAVDIVNHVIYGEVNSLSPFVIAQPNGLPAQTFLRGTAKPVTTTVSFVSTSRQAILRVDNGGLPNDKSGKVSSAVVYLNGVEVLGPRNFNQNTTWLEVPVTLKQGDNVLVVELRGKPGGAIAISIK